MRAIATDPAARGLADDAAVIEFGGEALVVTHDIMVEGVHWLPQADPADVAWKLVAVNLSDLAAKGAQPLGVLLGFMLGDADWDRRFAEGLRHACAAMSAPLLGGDTTGCVAAGRALGLTALGRATHRPVPSRGGAKAGDCLFVTGTVGNASVGFDLARSDAPGPKRLLEAFNRPAPRVGDGIALAPRVHAMMDVSDGLLLDARRMAGASGLALDIDIAAIPLSPEFVDRRGSDPHSRVQAASWGDDYQLLFAAPAHDLPVEATSIGVFREGEGLSLRNAGEDYPLPTQLGFEHR